jgi:outer membrane lipoprotein-sorting protein
MRISTNRRLRWAVPVVAGAVVATVAIMPSIAVGQDHPVLPERSAASLLAGLMTAPAPALSGTVVETARLGLPDLPTTGSGQAALSWENLATGTHTARVWLDGGQRQRIALLGDLAESDVVHNGRDVWVYSSTTNSVQHLTLPAGTHSSDGAADPAMPVLTPDQVAARVLAAVNPTTAVTVDSTAVVAGQPAYQLVLSPRDHRSLISSVTIALDSATLTPLRVQVYGADRTTPAFETAYTDISFTRPSADVFAFTPPAGARVHTDGHGSSLQGQPATAADLGRSVIGTGWTAVLVVSDVALPMSGDGTSQLALLTKAATRVPQGLLLKTALLTLLLTNDGQLYAGAVDAASLQQVAATGRPL